LKVCATCHRAEGQGTQVGPDLATVASRSPDDLVIHILDPNKEVASNYLNYIVVTKDGRTLSGLIAEETSGAVTLKRAEGATDIISRGQIEEIASSGISLMPEGLEQGMEPQALADLIGYLRSLQPAANPTAPPASR
ncbi:c-type cytochrome, partial [Singulisphaera rosea]